MGEGAKTAPHIVQVMVTAPIGSFSIERDLLSGDEEEV